MESICVSVGYDSRPQRLHLKFYRKPQPPQTFKDRGGSGTLVNAPMTTFFSIMFFFFLLFFFPHVYFFSLQISLLNVLPFMSHCTAVGLRMAYCPVRVYRALTRHRRLSTPVPATLSVRGLGPGPLCPKRKQPFCSCLTSERRTPATQ